MMRLNRSFVSVLLASLLFVGCLGGCSSQNPDTHVPDDLKGQVDAQTEVEDVGQSETNADLGPERDTVTIWVLWKENAYREEGRLYAVTEYDYDENGMRTGGRSYFPDGTFIRDYPNCTYTEDGNTITRLLVYSEEEKAKDPVHSKDKKDTFTIDEDGKVVRYLRESMTTGLYLACWGLNYDENGNLSSADDYLDLKQMISTEPVSTREFNKDKNGRIESWKVYGDEVATVVWDENGHVVTYAVKDTVTGKLKSDYIYEFEYKQIEVPAEYAVVAEALGMFLYIFT